MNVALLKRPASAPVTIVATSDDYRRLALGRYEYIRELKLSNGESITRVLPCRNPVWACLQLDKAGYQVGERA